MKILNLILIPSIFFLSSLVFISADHIDAPAVASGSSDIADFYAFQSEADNNNMVFAVTLHFTNK